MKAGCQPYTGRLPLPGALPSAGEILVIQELVSGSANRLIGTYAYPDEAMKITSFRHLLLIAGMSLLAACAGYGERVAPLPVPGAQPDAISVNGAEIVARGFVDRDAAEQAFGFDIRRAGLLPVQFIVDNQSGGPISVDGNEALLLDQNGNAWPLLSSGKATDRVKATVRQGESIKAGARASLLTGLAGAVAGAAIGVVTGGDVGETAGRGAAAGAAVGALGGGTSRYLELDNEINRDMLEKSLTRRPIAPGALVHGFLFFPGFDGEARSVKSIRLQIRFGDETEVVSVPVQPVAGSD